MTRNELIVAILSSSLLTSAITLIGEILLKRKERSINSHNHKEAKRIQVIEKIYADATALRSYDGLDRDAFVVKINALSTYISVNGLYIDKPCKKITTNLIDYFIEVSLSLESKNLVKQDQLFDKMIGYFNR